MERKPKYFDPQLPATFRFLAEAVKDRRGATKAIVYGAVKSLENLFSFLGQRSMDLGKKTGDALEQHISKAVAAALITGFGTLALRLSCALRMGGPGCSLCLTRWQNRQAAAESDVSMTKALLGH